MKILITGGTGFLGMNLISELLKGENKILVITRHSEKIKKNLGPKVSLIEGDLSQLDTLGSQIIDFDPEICIHLAWAGIPDYSFLISKGNLLESIKLIDFLIEETNCQKIISSGSCFEYGNFRGMASETIPEQNLTYIAWAKNSLKNYIQLRCKERNIEWAWFRIFYVFGSGQRPNSLIPSLLQAARNGHPSPIKNPSNANDFIFIDDVISAFKLACYEKFESGVYNLGSGQLYKVADIWSFINETINNPKIDSVKLGIELMGRDNLNFPSAIGCYADIKKASSMLKWSPKFNCYEGIYRLICSTASAQEML